MFKIQQHVALIYSRCFLNTKIFISPFCLFLVRLLAKMQYTTGINIKVITVDTESPHATVIPIDLHISEPSPKPIAIGIIPNTVVNVVINTGRKRDFPAMTTASKTLFPRSRHSLI